MSDNPKQAELFADSNRGIYIPQYFAESFAADHWQGMSESDLETLKAGPDSEFYWDSWQSVLDNAETVDGGKLYQDGELWVYWPQLAIDAANQFFAARVKYEESHIDAGDSYSHIPRESWDNQSTRDMVEKFAEIEHYTTGFKRETKYPAIDCMGLDSDQIADLALDNFEMKPGHIFGMSEPDSDSWIVLCSFPIGEIETQFDPSDFGVDELTFDLIRESIDAYIKEDCAYTASDGVWYAAIKRDELQSLISDAAKSKGK